MLSFELEVGAVILNINQNFVIEVLKIFYYLVALCNF